MQERKYSRGWKSTERETPEMTWTLPETSAVIQIGLDAQEH